MKGFDLGKILNPQTIKAGLKTGIKMAEKQAPAIAAGVAIAASLAAVIAAAKAGPEVKAALEEAHIKKNEKALAERMDPEHFSDKTPIVELSKKEKAIIFFKGYWKVILCFLLSATCMVGSVYFGNRQKAALTVLLTAAESKLVDLEGATKAVVGDKKFDQIKGAILDKKIEENPPCDGMIADTGNGKTLCLEPVFGVYYWSDIAAVKRAYADFYDLYVHSQQVYMEDLYHLLKIPTAYIPKLAGELGYMYDLEEGIEHKPEYHSPSSPDYTPRSPFVKLNGVEYPLFAMDMNNPKAYDQLLSEAHAKRQFHKWNNR